MKLNKLQFAEVVKFIMGLQPQNHVDLEELDRLIDIDVPEVAPSKISSADLDNLLDLMAAGTQKIEAIKSYRQLTGIGLKEAKEAVERYWRSNGHYDPTKLSREDLLRKLTNECYASESTVATINNFIESCFR